MKLAYLFVVLAFAVHQPAAGADLPLKMPLKTLSNASPFDWTGFYFGGHLGYATGTSNWVATMTGASTPPLSGSVDLFKSYDAFKGTGSYFSGLQAGYNYKLPSRLVVGIESDISPPNTITGTQVISSHLIGQASYDDTVLGSGTARGRIGYTVGQWLTDGTGGFAWTYDQLTRTQFPGMPAGGGAGGGTAESAFLWRLGWAAGAGVEVPIGPNWTAKLEYLFLDFGRRGVTFGQQFDAEFALQSIGLEFK
jgi:high affinity Mn2+ porin